MSERLKFMGRREEARLEVERLRLRIEGLRAALRDHLDPFESVESLREDLVFALATDFADALGRYREALAGLQAIEKALGEERG